MHEHTPSPHNNMILRCLAFLCSPVKVFRYYTDGSDICAQCETTIALPYAYYSPVSSILYILAGIGISMIMAVVPYLEELIALLLLIVFHHMFSAIVFGCFPWIDFDSSVRSIRAFCEDAKKELTKKSICYAIGVVIGSLAHYLLSK